MAQLGHQGCDELLALPLAELQPIARARQLPLQRRALSLQAGQRGADAGEVLGAGGQGGDEPFDPPTRLLQPGLDSRDTRGAGVVSGEELPHASTHLRRIEDEIQALLNPFEHSVVEVADRDPGRVAELYAAGDVAAAQIVGRHAAARQAFRLEVLAAVGALDETREEIRAVPRPADAEAPGVVACLGGVPYLAADDGRCGVLDDDVLGVRQADLAAFLTEFAVPRFTVGERAQVDHVAQDPPHGPLRPCRPSEPAERGGRRDTARVEPLGDGTNAEAAGGVGLEDFPHDRGLDGVDDEHDALAAGLPTPGPKRHKGLTSTGDRAPVPIRWRAARPVPQRGVRVMTAANELAELVAELVGQRPLEGLYEVACHAVLVGARLVGVDHADASAPERVLVKRRLVGIEAAEAGDVVHKDVVGLAPSGLRADLEQRQKVASPGSVKTRRVVGELSDDAVAVLAGPRPHRRPLLLDRQILGGCGSAVERVGRDHTASPPAVTHPAWYRTRSTASRS